MSLVESFRASPQRRQVTIIAVGTAALCALLFAVYFLVLRKPYDVLFTDLRPMDAATIVAELDKKKIPYRLQDGGGTILVPENLVDATRLNVMSSDLPLKGMVGFELFNKSDMGLTEFAQKINYQRALQGELARTIMTMDAVDTARVHLSLTEPTIFRDDRVPPKASVTILTRPGKVLTAGAVRGVQRLVAAAVPELELANVVVLDKRGEVLSGEYMPELASPSRLSPATPAPAPASPQPWTASDGASRLSALNIGLVLVLPLLLLLFVAAFLLERRRGSVRVLTAQQRGEYTQRLKALLQREDADAV